MASIEKVHQGLLVLNEFFLIQRWGTIPLNGCK